jgi:hypothetical protein
MSKLVVTRLVAAVALLVAATSAILAAGLPSPAAASTAGWSSGTLIDASGGGLLSVSCPTASFCVAVDVDGYAFTYNGSSWSSAEPIDTGHAYLEVSCPTASFCVVVDEAGYALTYNSGSWSTAEAIDVGHDLTSVSCPTASFCATVGNDGGSFVTYNGSSWSTPASPDVFYSLESVSCPTASFCVAVDNDGNALTYNSGTWSSPDSIDTHWFSSVSCPTASFCVAVDEYGNAFTYNSGSWSKADDIDGTYELDSVSCPTASSCVAVDNNGNAFTYNGSSWSSPDSIDAGNHLSSVSCPTASFCAAVDLTGKVFTYWSLTTSTTTITSVTPSPVVGQPVSVGVQVSGPSTTSGSLTPSGQVSVSDGTRSCEATLSGSNGTASGTCSITEQAVGNYSLTASYPGDANFASSVTSGSTSLTVGKATSTTALGLSAAKVTYGDEGVAQLSVTVSPEYSGSTPNGTATVTQSTTTLCVITLSSAKGSCTLSATELAAGTYGLVATYGGSVNFGASASAQESLTVAKATTKTVLKLSARKVTYGDEQTEHLSVRVSPHHSGSKPTGTVRIKESTTTLCVITLSAGKGSCKLSAKGLKVDTYHLDAAYRGSKNFKRSTSPKETLTIAK